MNDVNYQIVLNQFPETLPEPEHFTCVRQEIPELGEGQVLIKNEYLSLDPYMRSQISGLHISGSIDLGDVMMGETVGIVMSSKSPNIEVGQRVRVMGGWQNYSVVDAQQVNVIPEGIESSHCLSILGMPGLTAYAGLMWQAQPKAGDVVVIPAATGAVGATAGQLAKAHDCKVIGIVGSDEKARYALDELGYDACINRKNEDVAQALDRLCPDGIDIYFDLVGGELLHRVSERLAVGARVILCGLIAETNSQTRSLGPAPALWIKARATVYGIVVYDFEARRAEFINACAPLVNSGQLKMKQDISEGIEQAPEAFCRLMRGDNLGKVLVAL